MCIYSKGQNNQGVELMREAKKDFENGYTINEDNAIYELYPYQVNWKAIKL